MARETVTPWWWARCQLMVSGPASRPWPVSFLAELDDQVDDLGGCRVRVGGGPSGAWLEGRLAVSAVAGQEFIEPGLRRRTARRRHGSTVLDHHRGDQQSVECHARTLSAGGTSLRDDWRHQSGMS